MLTVGITGPTGAGKTTFLRAVESLGGAVFDCDAVYRELLATSAPLLAAINGRFPGAVREGELDREALARRVFTDPKALDDLSAITPTFCGRWSGGWRRRVRPAAGWRRWTPSGFSSRAFRGCATRRFW